MIKRFGKKRVISPYEQYNGVIVELREGKLVAREYGINEFDEYDAEVGSYPIDLREVHKKKTELSKVREISRQLGDGNYVISSNAIGLISMIF